MMLTCMHKKVNIESNSPHTSMWITCMKKKAKFKSYSIQNVKMVTCMQKRVKIKLISRVRPFDGVRPLTLLSQHVKHTALSTHYSLTWLSALVTMIITNQLESNAWTSARHPSPMDWWSKCH